MSKRYSLKTDQPKPVSFYESVPTVEKYIRIERDYSQHGEICQFEVEFPSVLAGRIEKTIFEDTLNLINQQLYDAERISFMNFFDVLISCLSIYTIDFCYKTTYERKLKKLSDTIAEQNRIIYEPKGLHINVSFTSISFILFYFYFPLKFNVLIINKN